MNERIAKAVIATDYVATDRKSVKKIKGLSIKDYEKNIQSGFDKAFSLIERRIQLKYAIVQSNAPSGSLDCNPYRLSDFFNLFLFENIELRFG